MSQRLIALVLTLVGCGTAPTSGTSSEAAGAAQQPVPSAPTAAATPAPSPAVATPGAYSIAAATPAELPACTAANNEQLAYVKSTSEFESCDSGTWDVVPVAAASKNELLNVVAEPAGPNCATGGEAIQTGTDNNGDGKLEASEVTSTQYVCSGAAGTPGAAGASGANGLQITSIWRYQNNCTSCGNLVPIDVVSTSLATYIYDVEVTEFSNGSGFVSVYGQQEDIAFSPSYFTHSFFLSASSTPQAETFKADWENQFVIRYSITLGATPTFSAVDDTDGVLSNNPTPANFPLVKQ